MFGTKAILTDNHILEMLDPVAPWHLQPAFDDVLSALRQRGSHVLIALDGTE